MLLIFCELLLRRTGFDKTETTVAIFIALLRGINVGSTLLPMKDLVQLCSGLGFRAVRTYIKSGNVIFESRSSEQGIRSSLEKAVAKKMGRQIDVMVRTPAEM